MRTPNGRERGVYGADGASRRGALARCALVALVICAACEDRGPPDDVERTRTGGVEQVPRFATPDIGGGAAGVTAGTRAGAGGVSGGPQGEGGFGGTTVGGTDTATGARTGTGIGIPGPFGAGAGGFGGLGDVDGDGTRDGLGAGAGGSAAAGTGAAIDGFSGAAGTGIAGAGDTGIGNVIGTDIENRPPTASFEFSPQCVSDIQTEVTLTSTSVDPDGDPLRCEWTMPAGIPSGSSDCSLTATFFNAGESPVVLIVDDGRGGIRSATRDITACSNLAGGQPAELPP